MNSWGQRFKVSKFFSLRAGPGCSKLTTSLVNVSVKFQMLIFQIQQIFLLKKGGKLLTFFQKKYQCIWL